MGHAAAEKMCGSSSRGSVARLAPAGTTSPRRRAARCALLAGLPPPRGAPRLWLAKSRVRTAALKASGQMRWTSVVQLPPCAASRSLQGVRRAQQGSS